MDVAQANDINGDKFVDGFVKSMNESSEEERKIFINYVEENGVSGYAGFLEERLQQWETMSLRIAVTGSSGQGKSTIINTMRGLKPKSKGAAATGVVECTTVVNEYQDPKNPNLVYYDLPGVGTQTFPRDQYFTKIKEQTKDNIEFHQYDFFFIVSSTRFTEDDAWLATQIRNLDKGFYFIRSKIDQDMRNALDEDPENYDETAVLEEIRQNCVTELKKMLNGNNLCEVKNKFKIFLLSGKLSDYMKWDFPQLITSLLQDYPKLKRLAIVFSLLTNCKEVIREKAQTLRNNVWRKAVISGVTGAAMPIPGVSLVMDIAILTSSYEEYKNALGLDAASLDAIGRAYGTSGENIEAYMRNTGWGKYFIGGQITAFMITEGADAAASTMAAKAVNSLATTVLAFLPVIGNCIGGSINFASSYYHLCHLIDGMEDAALVVLDYVTSLSKGKV